MKIVTHPANYEWLKSKINEFFPQDDGITFRMNHNVEIITNSAIDKERPTGKYLVEGNDFFTWWDGEGEPPDWALHFGFVKPIMTPLFYEMMTPTRAYVFDPDKPPSKWAR